MWRGEMIVNMFISLFADTLNSAIHRYHPLSDWLTDIQAFSHSHNISRYHDHVITILILRYQISRTYNRMQMNLEMLRNMQGKDVQEKIRLAGCLATQLGKFLDLCQKKSTFIYFWMTLNIWVRLEIYVNPEPFTFLIFSDFHSIFPGTSSNWWILNICCLNICSWCKDSVGVGMKQFQILYHTLHKVTAWCALQIVQSTSRSREHCTFCEMHKRGPDLARAAHSLQKSRRVCSSRLWWVLFVLGNDAMPWHTVACHGMAWWVLFVLGNSQCTAE